MHNTGSLPEKQNAPPHQSTEDLAPLKLEDETNEFVPLKKGTLSKGMWIIFRCFTMFYTKHSLNVSVGSIPEVNANSVFCRTQIYQMDFYELLYFLTPPPTHPSPMDQFETTIPNLDNKHALQGTLSR